MARFVAIAETPGLTEAQFRQTFDRMRKWRPERRTWIIKAYCSLADARVVVECEAPERQPFEAWLQKTGWKIAHLHQVDFIHEAGDIWPM
jgi:hypothetical protein